MKYLITKSLIFTAFLILVLPSCNKEEESNQTLTEDSFSVKIDGELFETKSIITGLVGSEQQLFTFTQFSITAFKTMGSFLDENMFIFFTLPFDESLEQISYDYMDDDCNDPAENICAFMTYSNGVENGKAGGSKVNGGSSHFTITSIDFKKGGHVKGTFSGILKAGNTGELIEVTEGKFNVKIPD